MFSWLILNICLDLKLVDKNITPFYDKGNSQFNGFTANSNFSNILNSKTVSIPKIITKIKHLLELKEKNVNTKYSVNDSRLEIGLQQNGLSLIKNDEFSKDIHYYNSMFERIKSDLSSNAKHVSSIYLY